MKVLCELGNVNVDYYVKILENEAVSYIELLSNPSSRSDTITILNNDTVVFVYDNTSCHTVCKITQYLKTKWIPIMKWSAQSLDLNPM